MANIQNMSFVVWVHRDVTSGSLFTSFQGLEEYSLLLKWITTAKLKDPFTLQAVCYCQLNKIYTEDIRVMVGEEFCGSVWNQETWNGEVQNFPAVAPEAVMLLLEANLRNGDGEDPPENILLVEEPKKSNNGMGLSLEHLKWWRKFWMNWNFL